MQEIRIDDPFGAALAKYSNGLFCGVELGGGTGDGSTQCIRTKTLYSYEINPERTGRHQYNLDRRDGGIAVHALSSNPKNWMTENEIIAFYNSTPTNLNRHTIEQILLWLDKDLKIADEYDYSVNAMVRQMDFLLIDGGAFAGKADMTEWFALLQEGGIVALDDTNDIKNFHNYHWLKTSGHDCLWDEANYRNGSAIFRK